MKPYVAKFNVEVSYAEKYPFRQNEIVVVLGELANMPEHVIVCHASGHVSWGWHKENFKRLKGSET